MRISWIIPNILAASGTPATADDIKTLHEQGIRAIVTLTEHPLTIRSSITDALFTQLDTLHSAIPDWSAPTPEQARAIVDFLDNMTAAKRPAFIHCQAGIGRTGTLLHAYFIQHGDSLQAAREKVDAARFASSYLNLSDVQQEFLIDFERAHR